MSFYMLKPTGKIGFITPNSYLHNTSYIKFREFLKQNKGINTIVNFKSEKVFKGYSTYTAITIIDFNTNKDSFIYKELVDGKIQTVNNIYFEKLDSKKWSSTNCKDEEFLNYIGRNISIGDLFNVQYGIATLRDKIYVGKITTYEKNNELVYFKNHLIEKSILKTCIKGSTFKGDIDESFKIIFPYKKITNKYLAIPESEMEKLYPYCYQYFLSYKEELMSRDLDKGALWYEYGRKQGIQTIHNEKIILSTIIREKVNFYKIPADILMYSGIFITKKDPITDWDILEKVLSSDEFYQFIKITSKDFSGGYKLLNTKQIKNFKYM